MALDDFDREFDRLRRAGARRHRLTMIAIVAVWVMMLIIPLIGIWLLATSPEQIGGWLGRLASGFEAQH